MREPQPTFQPVSVPLTLPPLPPEPLVSVLMTNYNYATFIEEAIESVMSQTYRRWELIICDDGSTDDSLAVIGRYAQTSAAIHVIAKRNGGMGSALNAAYAASRGDIIALLDADDAFLPEKIEKVVSIFRKENAPGMVIHRMHIVDGKGKIEGTIPRFSRIERGYIAGKLYRRGGNWRYMPASAIALRREVARHLFPIDEVLFRALADAYLYTIAPLLVCVDYVEESLSLYRLHGKNMTGTWWYVESAVEKRLEGSRALRRGVNARLRALGLEELEFERHPEHVEVEYVYALQSREARFRQRWRLLRQLCTCFARDDLRPWFLRLYFILLYTLVGFAPRGRRLSLVGKGRSIQLRGLRRYFGRWHG